MTTFSFLSQLFFPECMISDSADVSKGMTSSELIQVNQLKSGASIAAIHRRDDKLKGKKKFSLKNVQRVHHKFPELKATSVNVLLCSITVHNPNTFSYQRYETEKSSISSRLISWNQRMFGISV